MCRRFTLATFSGSSASWHLPSCTTRACGTTPTQVSHQRTAFTAHTSICLLVSVHICCCASCYIPLILIHGSVLNMSPPQSHPVQLLLLGPGPLPMPDSPILDGIALCQCRTSRLPLQDAHHICEHLHVHSRLAYIVCYVHLPHMLQHLLRRR